MATTLSYWLLVGNIYIYLYISMCLYIGGDCTKCSKLWVYEKNCGESVCLKGMWRAVAQAVQVVAEGRKFTGSGLGGVWGFRV